MQPRQLIAVIVLPMVLIFLGRSWSATLRSSERKQNTRVPPAVLTNAHAQLQNRLANLQIQAKGTLQQQFNSKLGIAARAFQALQAPGSLFWNAPGAFVDWKSLNGNTQVQLLNLSNEVQRLYLEYRTTTRNSLPPGFPRS